LAVRFRIPEQATGVKKYLSGTGPVSKTSHNVEAAASLGDSEILSVKNAPRQPIPALGKEREDCFDGFPELSRKKAGYVLEDEPSGLRLINQANKFQGKVGSGIEKPFLESGHGPGLARGAAHD
jgi:hypothetical protein